MNLILSAVALLWLQLFVALIPTWRDGEYYSYGWFVPFLAVGLGWRRWQYLEKRPETTGEPPRFAPVVLGLLVLGVIAIAPLRLIGLADPGWRPPLLLHVALVVGISHFLLWRAFGRRVSITCMPVTLFALSAVPWPWQLEQYLIRSLTGMVTAVTREWFLLGGQPVELLGERLSMGREVVEVNDGCSGIRSLQSLVMVSLFFGELFLLTAPRRLWLLMLAGISALGFNTLRASWLASVHFTAGLEAAAAAHDRIGHTTFLLSAATLWLAAFILLQTTHCPKSSLRRTIQGPHLSTEQKSEI
jgi:exosortase